MAGDRVSIPHVRALDGLRGAAVAGVVLYHGDHLTGGYLGVDLFFVLSGFLITSLLLAECERERAGSRSGAFWARRARRLLPALVLMLARRRGLRRGRSPAPTELGRIRGDALATLGYVANWHAIFADQSYLDLFARRRRCNTRGASRSRSSSTSCGPGVRRPRRLVAAANTAWRCSRPRSVLGGCVGRAHGRPVRPGRSEPRVLRHRHPRVRALRRHRDRRGRMRSGATHESGVCASCGGRGRRRRARPRGDVGDARRPGRRAVPGRLRDRRRCGCARHRRGGHPSAARSAGCFSFPPLCWLGLISYGLYLWHWPVDIVLDADASA